MESPIPTVRRSFARVGLWAAAVLILGAAVACGGSGSKKATTTTLFKPVPSTAYTGDPAKACGLAPKSDVEAALGAPVKPGEGVDGRVCRYELVSSAAQFVVIQTTQSPEASNIYDLSFTSATGAEALTGVGDKAFVTSANATVLRSSTITVVTLTTTQAPAAKAAALKKLAQTVASHS